MFYHTYTCDKKHMYGIFMGETIQRIQKAVEIPSDVARKVPILTIIGSEELTLENYRGILEYTEKVIRVQTKTGQIRIAGVSLNIDCYTNEEMCVVGQIHLIEYLSDPCGG